MFSLQFAGRLQSNFNDRSEFIAVTELPLPEMLHITSSHNPRFKSLLQLRTAKHRKRTGLFIIDGELEIRRAIACNVEIQMLIGTRSTIAEFSPEHDCERLSLADSLMAKLAYGERAEQFMAVATVPSRPLGAIEATNSSLVLVLDRLEKPGNIGACLRTAAAAGVHTTILSDPICDIWNPNVIRASRGAVFGKRLAISTGVEVREWLKELQIATFLAMTDGDTPLWQCQFSSGAAIVLGNEANGLGPEWAAQSQRGNAIPFQIPMASDSRVDSLNVSISAAITLYEAARQRVG